jgi:hypothetical protein
MAKQTIVQGDTFGEAWGRQNTMNTEIYAGPDYTGAYNDAYATVASHATTSAIWAAAGNVINFTGAETITDFPAADQAGSERTLICAGATVFTHAGNITVQGGATYTAAANESIKVTALTTTTFLVKPPGIATVAQMSKLDAIEASADVTDTTNVTAAGALMDSEVDADLKTLSLPASTTISAFGASLVDDAAATNARTTLGLAIGTDVLAEQTIGIADDNLLEVDGSPNNGEYGKFTANGIEGKTVAEMKTDLGTDYDTVWIGAGAMVPCTTNGAAASTEEYGTNDIDLDILAFDTGATEERAQFTLVMPETWDRSTVKVKFFWGNATGASAADTVEWGIKAGALSNDDAIDAALGGAVVITDTVIADGDLHVTSATPALTVGGTPALGDLIQFEVYRNTDGTDDMAEDAWLIGCWIQFLKTNTVSAW